jgi:putative Flp pilus-assembly TadE/G-like protein
MSRLRHEAGQTVVLFAVLLPLFLGLGAIAVDIGYWYVVKKTAQDAADAAALAAARELPDPCAAIAKGEEYGLANMPGATVTVIPPTSCGPSPPGAGAGAGAGASAGGEGSGTGVLVTVSHDTGAFFGRVFGIAEPRVTASAVAELTSSGDNLAVFAYDGDCVGNPLEFGASDVYINGFVHANGRFKISDGPFWALNGTFDASGGSCPPSVEPGVLAQFGEDRPPPWGTACGGSPCREPLDGEHWSWASTMWFTPAQFGWPNCTYQADSIEITADELRLEPQGDVRFHGGVIPSGTYCARNSFTIDGDNLRGRLTALAPEITVEGEGLNLSAFSQNMLFFAIPNPDSVVNDGPPETTVLTCVLGPESELKLTGSGSQWAGIIFNPCGRVSVNLDVLLEGAILGNEVFIGGDGFEMIGRGDFEYSTALVE